MGKLCVYTPILLACSLIRKLFILYSGLSLSLLSALSLSQACTEVDEEGFFEGVLRGKRGLVPSNMVDQVTDSEQLANIEQLIAEQKSRSPGE